MIPGMCTIRANASLSPIQPVNGSVVVTVAVLGMCTQQGDFADDRAGGDVLDGHHAVVADVLDLGRARRDEQERNRLLALLHEDLARGGL